MPRTTKPPAPTTAIGGSSSVKAFTTQMIPQHITAVPGGTGPIEMTVLADPIIRRTIDQGSEPSVMPRTVPDYS